MSQKEKIDNLEFIKIDICSLKDTYRKVKGKLWTGENIPEKIFIYINLIKKLAFRICGELLYLNSRGQITQFNKGITYVNRYFTKEDIWLAN